jgi:hypothetical protein
MYSLVREPPPGRAEKLQEAALVLSAGVAALFFTIERTQLRSHA